MLSPYGEEFRGLMNTWDKQKLLEEIADHKNKIKAMIEGGPMILFVKHKDSGHVYGCDEPSRVVFARMNGKPDDDSPPEWADQASFMATNLSKMLNGEDGTDTVFGKKDLKKLDVMEDKDKLIDMLVHGMKGDGRKNKTIIVKMGGSNPAGIPLGSDYNEL
jgi:hypothetical protein